MGASESGACRASPAPRRASGRRNWRGRRGSLGSCPCCSPPATAAACLKDTATVAVDKQLQGSSHLVPNHRFESHGENRRQHSVVVSRAQVARVGRIHPATSWRGGRVGGRVGLRAPRVVFLLAARPALCRPLAGAFGEAVWGRPRFDPRALFTRPVLRLRHSHLHNK